MSRIVSRIGPRGATYVVAGIIALSFAHDLMRKPIQVSDSLQELIDVQQSPSLWSTFVAHSPRGPFLRPLRVVQIKMLLDAAGGHYQLAFRGFHAILVALALFLFVRALRVQTWTDCAAAVFAITVLTGMNTFRGTVREAFPINHFLEIVVFCLLALNLAQSRGGWWVDAAATVLFVVASLTLESGPLVWVVLLSASAVRPAGRLATRARGRHDAARRILLDPFRVPVHRDARDRRGPRLGVRGVNADARKRSPADSATTHCLSTRTT